MKPLVSLIVPTRERAAYLPHCIRSCLASDFDGLEVLVLDNASSDDTGQVVRQFTDSRLRYERAPVRLSMRDNFEQGIEISRGEIICFLGDDDGILPHAIGQVSELFRTYDVGAVSAARVHYFWPDLLATRRNSALVPRSNGISLLQSRAELHGLLRHCDYYRLPCVYHGFVRRDVIEKIKRRQGRLFLSSQVDMYSAVALSMEDVPYAFSRAPLVINGGSKRSNGASHFGGGGEKERTLWKKEDDLGFLGGFENCKSVGGLIVESALRYAGANGVSLDSILDIEDVRRTLATECLLRKQADPQWDDEDTLWSTVGLERSHTAEHRGPNRLRRLVGRFLETRPVDLGEARIENVYDATLYLERILREGRTGFFADRPVEQLKTAWRIARS